MELTLEQARELLAALGVSIPDFLLQALVDQANSIDPCLIENGVDPATGLLIKVALISLLGISQGARAVTSERAPSGAARSYGYGVWRDPWNSAYNRLRLLDKFNCAGALIPEDPNEEPQGFFGVIGGGCGCKTRGR